MPCAYFLTPAATAARWCAANAKATPNTSPVSTTAGPTTVTDHSTRCPAKQPIRRTSTVPISVCSLRHVWKAAAARRGQSARHWSCGDRHREFPWAAGGALDTGLRGGGEARDREDARRTGRTLG